MIAEQVRCDLGGVIWEVWSRIKDSVGLVVCTSATCRGTIRQCDEELTIQRRLHNVECRACRVSCISEKEIPENQQLQVDSPGRRR